ncbi:inner membrane-spanning protein YciB [Pleionea litopenaei]|uniref:Inner membrane-spanning protein YciB n=1 Tax=Pleionea litopenaei TaxID=3070815 RepID=A0AA51RTB0_9GAMM|nr:inner membrane-spanning protein YciB [Pleionea sp. HL-JVS1]WMS87197.1 inner membrane-spanning protein YciB [Pleionea sp. HL-JVS1]
MKVLLDFFPVLAFFLTYKLFDVYVATAVLIGASLLQTLGHRIIKKRFEKLHVMTFVISLIMGGMTIAFRDDAFIKWKVSVVYWILSAVIWIYWLRGTMLLKQLFESLFKQELGLTQKLWGYINAFWGLLLLAMGGLNIWIAYHFDLDTWVNFKVWGTMAVQLVTMIGTFVVIFKNMPEHHRKMLEESSANEEN